MIILGTHLNWQSWLRDLWVFVCAVVPSAWAVASIRPGCAAIPRSSRRCPACHRAPVHRRPRSQCRRPDSSDRWATCRTAGAVGTTWSSFSIGSPSIQSPGLCRNVIWGAETRRQRRVIHVCYFICTLQRERSVVGVVSLTYNKWYCRAYRIDHLWLTACYRLRTRSTGHGRPGGGLASPSLRNLLWLGIGRIVGSRTICNGRGAKGGGNRLVQSPLWVSANKA